MNRNKVKMAKYILMFISALILLGCEPKMSEYRCTEDQLRIVEKEIKICVDNDKRKNWCYDIVRKSQCRLISEEKQL